MASPPTPPLAPTKTPPSRTRQRWVLSEGLRYLLVRHGVGVAAFAAPLIALAWLTNDLMHVSNFHANTIAKDLLALDRGRLEFIGFVYPPAPFLLALLRPTPFALSMMSAVIGGITGWMVWRDTGRGHIDPLTRIAVTGSVVLLPQFLFSATNRIENVIILYLLIVAWHRYLRFTNSGETAAGFLAGLLLGLGFFVNVSALPLAIALAGLSPLFVRAGAATEGRGARLAAVTVVLFPALVAFGAWTYLNWLFTGDWFFFIRDPASPLRALSNAEAQAVSGLNEAISATGADLFRAPVYLVMAMVVATHGRRRVAAFLAPVLVITVTRWLGFAFAPGFAVATYAVLGVAAMPRATHERWAPLLVIAALFQIGYGWANLPDGADETVWFERIEAREADPLDVLDEALADRLADAPSGSILADDTSAFEVIARGGTAAPYVLPADPGYDLIVSAPAEFVDYVLVADPSTGVARAGDRLTARYATDPPPGFVTEATVASGWVLHRRIGAPPIIAGAAPAP